MKSILHMMMDEWGFGLDNVLNTRMILEVFLFDGCFHYFNLSNFVGDIEQLKASLDSLKQQSQTNQRGNYWHLVPFSLLYTWTILSGLQWWLWYYFNFIYLFIFCPKDLWWILKCRPSVCANDFFRSISPKSARHLYGTWWVY